MISPTAITAISNRCSKLTFISEGWWWWYKWLFVILFFWCLSWKCIQNRWYIYSVNVQMNQPAVNNKTWKAAELIFLRIQVAMIAGDTMIRKQTRQWCHEFGLYMICFISIIFEVSNQYHEGAVMENIFFVYCWLLPCHADFCISVIFEQPGDE